MTKKSRSRLIISVLILVAFMVGIGLATAKRGRLPGSDSAFSDHYYYDRLSGKAQEAYQGIYQGYLLSARKITLSVHDIKTLQKVKMAVLQDHPEIFWVMPAFDYRDEDSSRISLYPRYSCTKDEIRQKQEAIDRVVEDFLKKMPEAASDREKIKYVYEYLIDTVKYDDSVPPDRDQNMDSALLGKRTVCAGYAKATRYLLDQIGIPSIYVSDEEHAWNKVVCDHKTYTMDVTWGAVESQEAGTINYDYLLVP